MSGWENKVQNREVMAIKLKNGTICQGKKKHNL